jgi:hypothetical protein
MRYLRYVALASSSFALAAAVVAGASADQQPKAKPSPRPPAFAFGGFVRSYDFTRQNASGFANTFKAMNQGSVNTAVSLRANYRFNNSPFSIGATYLYANPGACVSSVSHLSIPCGKHSFVSQGSEPVNPDDTLPGYEMSTLYEAYLQYKDPNATVRLGNQVVNSPWANPSDSRLKPVAFQGLDASFRIDARWNAEVMYMARFEGRATSDFDNATLLTSHPADAPGAASNIFTPGGTSITTPGFGYARLGFASGNLSANVHYYGFLDIANAVWLDAKYAWSNPRKPFVAVQLGSESNAGRAVVGKISSQVFGVQAGFTPLRNLDLTLAYDLVPQRSDTLSLPASVSCGSNNQIKTAAGVTFPYFLPAGGTTNCFANPDGTTTVYYGGWASPYTDSYATDPFFTTQFAQGMVDRRSPGQALKFGATYVIGDKHFRFIASRAYYTYGSSIAGVSPTQETDLDGTWFFRKPAAGAYHGFSLRHRYAERTQANTQLFGGTPIFKYNRTQLEYDF